MSAALSIVASGAVFGGSLLAAGVIAPSVIVGQMQLTDMHMLKVFVVGSASSALVLRGLQRLGYILKARAPTNLGWLGNYDGNIIGGLLIGIGMTLTGSCPGTVFAQFGSGIQSGPYTLAGGFLGGIMYTSVSKNLKTQKAKDSAPSNLLTIPQKTGMDANIVLLLFEALCASIVALSTQLSPNPSTRLSPLFGGLLIGFSQLTSVLLTKSTLGISSSYEEVGEWFWRVITPSTKERVSSTSIIFALGATCGSFAVSRIWPELVQRDVMVLGPSRTVVGGAVMAFGSRLGSGCTSGHGISGMSLLSVSSIISVISMFAGGIMTAAMMARI
ncbi:hypothetical protein FKW77_005961 [Venturia effusa]|uniref:Uncharacterized protein n=1 Tax=Venturia effusa TaxID=50376 RepID=A0A517LHB1_9PEZI|nr:hypothetical protein FKW77_005961 [Venturia effusa]